MATRRVLLPLLLALPLAACGDDAPPADPDAGPPEPDAADLACAELEEPAGTINSYPGTFSGTVTGAGADLRVNEDVCTVEGDPENPDDDYYDPVGEDAVVALTGLTAGTRYGVIVDSADDLGFYVITGCDEAAGGPITGQCPVFDDRGIAGESSPFTADASSAFVVIDTANLGGPPETGDFELRVVEVDCVDSTECAEPTPACVDFGCVECETSFDCTDAAEPVCDTAGTCVAGPTECTGDDVGDTAGSDDGPAGARSLTAPTAGVPTTQAGAVCSQPASEQDWYEFTVATADTFGFELTFPSATDDLDLFLLDATGAVLVQGINEGSIPEAFAASLQPGNYYLVTTMYAPPGTVAASSYTLTLRLAECTDSFDCLLPTDPVCGPSGVCDAGPANCTGDDTGDTTLGGDDGPAGARSLTGVVGTPVALTGAVCNDPGIEIDFYSVTVLQGEGVTIDLDWTGTADLDIYTIDDQGVTHGLTFWTMPENVTLTYLPAGTYYIQVALYSTSTVTAAVPYTVTATRTAAAVCTSAADCAAEYSTQLYRGSCTAGACDFIAPGEAVPGAPCDSADDCMSDLCSYIPFEADAAESICTDTCTTTADCLAIGAGLNCSAGNFGMCVPACTTNLECGAATSSNTLDVGEPWDYYACNAGTGVCTF